MEWSGYAVFRRLAVQLNSVLETRGRPLLQSGSALILVSQFEQLFSGDAAERLRDLPVLLRGARREKDPLTLSEARTILNCCLLDTLCSMLEKLQWSQICSRSDAVSRKRGCMMLADSPWTASMRRCSHTSVSSHPVTSRSQERKPLAGTTLVMRSLLATLIRLKKLCGA